MITTNSNPTTMPTTFPESLALGLFFSTFSPLVLPTVCSFTVICGVSVGGSSPFSAKIENIQKLENLFLRLVCTKVNLEKICALPYEGGLPFYSELTKHRGKYIAFL